MKTAKKVNQNVKVENLSTLTMALEKAHQIIKEETGAPSVTILVTRNLKGRKGHFTPFTPWSSNEGQSFNEIAFNLEHFSTGEELLSTLLHEVAHSLNFKNGIQDCSANQYHNGKFKSQAEALGLKTLEVKGKGHASTELTEFGAKRWAKALKIISDALALTATGEGSQKPKGRNTNLIKAECACGNVIRLSRTVLEIGVTCNACKMGFGEA
ncbi:hypothetical protein uvFWCGRAMDCOMC440_035 [Freshwater phage uvFW-CGR-AMD-COM-C440]|nr:hypothetical protein uvFWCGRAMDCOMC440_035 [Freshwater phage uvFW-CGR-AMD-COM-C440]